MNNQTPILESPAMKKVWSQALAAGKSEAAVLITGETGAGKGVIATAIHANSKRQHRALVKLNMPGIPRDLVETELFGAEKGAYTGAHKTRVGMIETANGSTLFLDEIGDMDQALQAKLHDFIDDRKFRRVGGSKLQSADVRLLFATSRDLETMVESRQFRPDLYYRMRVLSINIPPLRDRKEDILPLAYRSLKRTGHKLAPSAEFLLLAYHWPGNVRELQNAIEQAVHQSDDKVLEASHFTLKKKTSPVPLSASAILPLAAHFKQARMDYIRSTVETFSGNKLKAAEALQCSVATVYRAFK